MRSQISVAKLWTIARVGARSYAPNGCFGVGILTEPVTVLGRLLSDSPLQTGRSEWNLLYQSLTAKV